MELARSTHINEQDIHTSTSIMCSFLRVQKYTFTHTAVANHAKKRKETKSCNHMNKQRINLKVNNCSKIMYKSISELIVAVQKYRYALQTVRLAINQKRNKHNYDSKFQWRNISLTLLQKPAIYKRQIQTTACSKGLL